MGTRHTIGYMKPLRLTLFALVCVVACACGSAAQAQAGASPSTSPQTTTAPYPFVVALGGGSDQPGVVSVMRGGATLDGPPSVAIDDTGHLLLIDQAKHRILFYDPASSSVPMRTMALPAELPAQATGLLVSGDRLYMRAALDPQRTTVTEWELDANTGVVLRTAQSGPASTALYPAPRYPGGEWSSAIFGRDRRGYRYDLAYIPNCTGGTGHDCYEVRRFDGQATIAASVAIAQRPPFNELRDLYVASDGAVYALRWQWSADRTQLLAAVVLRLLGPTTTTAPGGELYPVRLTGYVRDYAKMAAAGALPNSGVNGSALLAGAVVRLDPYGLEVRSAADGTFIFPPVAVPAPCRWVSVVATSPGYGVLTLEEVPLYAPDLGTYLNLWLSSEDVHHRVGPPRAARDLGDKYCSP